MSWSAAERFSQHAVQFVVQLVLARILLPQQFGLIAMVVVFVAISRGITDAGFSQAIIQRDELTRSDLDTAFYCNLVLGAFFSIILWSAAPVIATFYREPELTPIVQAISFVVVLSSVGIVQQAQMIKALDFRRMLAVNIPATLLSGMAAVIMAVNGWGVWALVTLLLLQNALKSLIYWIVSPWHPGLSFSWSSFKSLVPYGSRLALAGVLQQIFNNLYVLFIGKFFVPVDVGFYQRADSFKKFGSENLNAITARVTFPLFARVQHEPERMKRGFLYAISLLALFFSRP